MMLLQMRSRGTAAMRLKSIQVSSFVALAMWQLIKLVSGLQELSVNLEETFTWPEVILNTSKIKHIYQEIHSNTNACANYYQSFQVAEKGRRNWDNAKHINDSHDIEFKVANDLFKSLSGSPDYQLPAMTASYAPNHPEHLQACENFFFKQDQLDQRYTIAELGLMGLLSMVHSTVYRDSYTHRYDNYQEMKLASGLGVDQELCLRQLGQLNERARALSLEKFHSRDINLYQLLDTYGRTSSGLLLGASFYEGMYSECIRLKINGQLGESWPTRYCVATVKHSDWPKLDKFDVLNLKLAVCLPASCDSFNYKNKYDLVQQLIEHQVRQDERNLVHVNNLYCLPDEESPLRSIRSSPASLLTLTGLLAWLSILIYATIKHANIRPSAKITHDSSSTSDGKTKFGLTSRLALEANGLDSSASEPKQKSESPDGTTDWLDAYKLLSINNNLKLLFDTKKQSSLIMGSDSVRNSNEDNTGHNKETQTESPRTSKLVDLRCIEGIKVIAMCYVITGHVLMCSTSLMSNGREFASSKAVAFWLANLVPAFAVNCFFTITGLLTCYLVLKQGQNRSLLSSPTSWLAFIIYRYLRIMPMYALVVLYAKYLAKFTGSGPLWDYGTSSLGQRRACEQEAWSNVWLFKANFIPPLEHCIPSAWYLANDFHFFLVTPIFLACLHWSAKWGEQLLKASILMGFLAGLISILASQVDDLRPIARFSPHGFKTYISHFSSSYTAPQYRIPAYLIGLLIGHRLYQFERRQLNGRQEFSGWPDWFKRHAIGLCLLLVTVCCITPVVGSRLQFNKVWAKLMVAIITNLYHIVFSASIGIYILLATTGFGNKHLDSILAASFWKPLARLSLCAVLINVEVINYIIQTNTNLHYLSNQFLLGLNIICILATYLVSILVCVLFEAPIRGILNGVLRLVVENFTNKRKTSK